MPARTAPPVFGLFFLAACAGGVAFCALSPDNPVDAPPVATASTTAAPQSEPKAGADATRMSDVTRRQILREA